MKLCWLDVRTVTEGKEAILEEAIHQRVDGIFSNDLKDLVTLPPTCTRVLFAEHELTTEDGLDNVDVVITGSGDAIDTGELDGSHPHLRFGTFVDVHDQHSLDIACRTAATSEWTVLNFRDPTTIPLEIVLAAANNAAGSVITIVGSLEEAEIILGVLERGAEGVMLAPKRVGEATMLKEICTIEGTRLQLTELTVEGIKHIGMGDRACVDTCSHFREDEGILVGSHARGMILCCSETHPLPYMPTRPFRVNAGAVHSYTVALNGRTNYLSELHTGSKILGVDHTGQARTVVVGRVKIERRPLLSVTARSESGVVVNVVVQDDWHVRVLGPRAAVLNVTELAAGDRVLGYLPSEERHVGYPIDEFCIES